MSATPERAENDTSKARPLSRLKRLRKEWVPDWAGDVSQSTVEALREHYMPEMPPLEEGGHLVGYLFEMGPTLGSSMGASPYAAIDSWCNRMGIDLQPWESRVICRLSSEYMSESQKAEQRDCPAPWADAPYSSLPALERAMRTRDAIRALATL